MEIVILVGFLSVFCAFLEGKFKFKYGLLISFFIIFVFLALRYDYGNDYVNYLDGFNEINRTLRFDIFDKEIHFEPGWILLCKLFKPVGFFGFVAFLSLLNCMIYYRLIKRFVPANLYWLSVFLYVFATDYLLIQLSSMRQTLAILIFIYSIQYISEKKFLYYVCLILLASTFHNSALILLPLYFLGYAKFKMNKFYIGIIFLLYILVFLSKDYLTPVINLLVSSFNEGNYQVYDEEGVSGSGFGIILLSIFFILVLISSKKQTENNKIIYHLSIMYFILIPFGLIIMMLGRISMYFSVYLIVIYPLVFNSINNKFYKYAFLFLLFMITFTGFFGFFKSPIWIDKYEHYQTIFSVNGY